eukprot:2991518-Amphidinium_carterae.1
MPKGKITHAYARTYPKHAQVKSGVNLCKTFPLGQTLILRDAQGLVSSARANAGHRTRTKEEAALRLLERRFPTRMLQSPWSHCGESGWRVASDRTPRQGRFG